MGGAQSMPSITPAQIGAVLAFVLSQLVAFGVLDAHRSQVLLSVGGTVIAVVLPIAESYLRGKRVQAYAANPVAFGHVPPTPPTTPAA